MANDAPDGEIVKAKTQEELKDRFRGLDTMFDSHYVLSRADDELKKLDSGIGIDSNTYIYKSMTLFEFDKGVLMGSALPESSGAFALEFSKNLQAEYKCTTPSEKSLTEVIAINFVRIIEAQRKIKDLLGHGLTKLDIAFLNTLSKELDNAERHYQSSLQALRMLKMPPLTVNVKTQTAIVGQNQVVQTNNHE